MIDFKAKPFYLGDDDIRWVESTLSSLSTDEKIGQLFCHIVYDADEETIRSVTEKYRLGGVMCRPMNGEESVRAVERLQKGSKIPMLIAANLENGGRGAVKDAVRVGSQMAVAATGNTENASILGDISGKEGGAYGVNWSFAPICDIDYNFRNPITNTRTFGSDPLTVEKCALSYIRECQKHGVAATAKHFPGDGMDERDQHLVSSINSLSPEEWDSTYGRIYRAAIDEGVMTIMTGHILQPGWSRRINPSLKDEEILPASLSKELLLGLLREHLGFNGLIVTDSTTMAGFNAALPRAEAVPATIAAGADMFLFALNLDEDFAFMKKGVESGVITPERLDEAVMRILALKAALGLHRKSNIPDGKKAAETVREDEALGLERKIADESITLVKNRQDVFPITPERYRRILFYPIQAKGQKLEMYGAESSANARFVEKLRSEGFTVTVFQPLPGFEGMVRPQSEILDNYDLIIYSANLATKSNQTTVRIEWKEPMGADVPIFFHTIPTIFISLENPYHLLDVPRVKTYINVYGFSQAALDSLVDKLMGRSEFKGKSPVDAFCGKWDTRL